MKNSYHPMTLHGEKGGVHCTWCVSGEKLKKKLREIAPLWGGSFLVRLVGGLGVTNGEGCLRGRKRGRLKEKARGGKGKPVRNHGSTVPLEDFLNRRTVQKREKPTTEKIGPL